MDLFYIKICNFKAENRYRKGHNAGRYVLEYCAENIYHIQNPEIELINKKPSFKNSSLQFSISHSGEYAAVCFDKNPVGFDMEQITKRDYKEIAKRMKFELEEDSLYAFYRCWTEYEAAYKLHGEVKYRFSDNLNENYIFSIASGNKFKLEKIQELFL